MITREVQWEHEAEWHLPCDPEAIGKGRDMARDTLESWGLGSLLDEVLVIISELCTNAVRYGGPPIRLTLRSAGLCLRGEVMDQGRPFVPAPRRPGDDDEHGRGLLLVQALADKWGVTSSRSGIGKTVWFTKGGR